MNQHVRLAAQDVLEHPCSGADKESVEGAGRTARRDRTVQLAPFALVSTAPLALTLVFPVRHGGALVAAMALTAVVAAVITWLPWEKLPPLARAGPVALYCSAVASARHGLAASAGLFLLLLLPVLWQALYSRRRDLALAVGLTALSLAAPIVLVGGPRYPATDWALVTLWTVVAGTVGLVANDLVQRLRMGEETMVRITTVAHGLTSAGDNREAICRAALEVAEADLSYLFEPSGDGRLRSTAAAGAAAPELDIDIGEEPSATVATLRSGSPQFFSDLDVAVASRRLNDLTGARSGLYQPVLRGQLVVGVLVVVWRSRRRKLPAHTRSGVALLAAEAALAMERADQMSAAARLARLDPLTGLPNRRWWDEEAARVLAVHHRGAEPLAVGLIDLDRFKRFNDAHGHHMGDLLLKEAAAAWREALRTGDLLARWGGEEFAVLLPAADLAAAAEVLERVRSATPRGQSCSIGVTAVEPGDTLADAMARADAALYRAKGTGRARLEISTAEPLDAAP